MEKFSIRVHHSFAEVVSEIESIIASNKLARIFTNPNIISAWYECYRGSRSVCIISMWHGELCIGVYPLVFERKFGINILNTLYKNSFSISYPVVLDGYIESFYSNLIPLLFRSKLRWDVLKFSYLFSFDKESQLLGKVVNDQASRRYVYSEPTYCIDLGDNVEAYASTYLNKKVRDTCKKRKSMLYRETSPEFVCYSGDEAMDHLDEFLSIQERGWRVQKNNSLVSDDNDYIFLKIVAKAFADEGKLALFFLIIDGVKAAGRMAYFENGVLQMLKSVYDLSYKQYSPSTALLLYIVEYYSRENSPVNKMNLFPVSFGYKQRFAHASDSSLMYVVFNKGFLSYLLEKVYKYKMSKWIARKSKELPCAIPRP